MKTNTLRLAADRGAAKSGCMMATNHWLRNALAALVTVVACGCSSPGATTDNGAAPIADTTAPDNVKTVAQLLDAARTGPASERARNLLDACDLLLQQDQPEQAAPHLKTVGDMPMSPALRGRYKELSARLLLRQGRVAEALSLLRDPQLLQEQDQLPAREQGNIALVRARALALNGDYFASAQERVFIAPLLSDRQRAQNQKDLWQALMYLDAAQLQGYRDKAANETLRGWLELALIAKTDQGNIDMQAAQLGQWTRRWSAHPAAGDLPADLAAVREMAAAQPRQVALLLPLSGKLSAFGAAVRDGFMAAWYDARERGGNPPALRVYDTGANANFLELYRQAVADGANLIVGPLEKPQVALLYQQPPSVPTLALNRADIDQIPPANLYQFSLAPEDEAAQIADIAYQEGRRHALIIAAEDESRSRELQVFSERWRQQGGDIAAAALYTDQQDLSQSIRTALNLPQSEARAKEVETLIHRNVEFTPHRRQDVDMVLMLAKPQQARSIKPMLAFYYAGDIPVYALSRIYNGFPNPDQDRDMDSVRFTDMPWVLEDQPLKKRILADQPQSRNYLRLYAMGIDSFLLYPRLRQMEKARDSRVYGQTGYLTLNAQLVVQRQLLLAQMRNGRPELIPAALLRQDTQAVATERLQHADIQP